MNSYTYAYTLTLNFNVNHIFRGLNHSHALKSSTLYPWLRYTYHKNSPPWALSA